MASERSTDVQAFIGELDGGVFETKIGAVLSEVASGVQEDQGQLLTLAGEPDGKLRAAGR